MIANQQMATNIYLQVFVKKNHQKTQIIIKTLIFTAF